MSSLIIQDAGVLKSAETAQGLEPEVMGLSLGHPLIPSVSFLTYKMRVVMILLGRLR